MNTNNYNRKIVETATPTGKANKGTITIESVDGRLRLRFKLAGKPCAIKTRGFSPGSSEAVRYYLSTV
jgi:hypothetical protein